MKFKQKFKQKQRTAPVKHQNVDHAFFWWGPLVQDLRMSTPAKDFSQSFEKQSFIYGYVNLSNYI